MAFRKFVTPLMVLALLPAGALAASGSPQTGATGYEVWAIDQSNSQGLNFGGTLYIWNGHDLENMRGPAPARVEQIDLGGAAAALCFAQTGIARRHFVRRLGPHPVRGRRVADASCLTIRIK